MSTFTPEQVEGLDYQEASTAFLREVGCSPRDVIRDAHEGDYEHPPEIIARARFLDAWDVWLFTEDSDA